MMKSRRNRQTDKTFDLGNKSIVEKKVSQGEWRKILYAGQSIHVRQSLLSKYIKKVLGPSPLRAVTRCPRLDLPLFQPSLLYVKRSPYTRGGGVAKGSCMHKNSPAMPLER